MTTQHTPFDARPPRPPRRFRFAVPLFAFEKSDAPEGRRRRIGGLVSTETRDREDETILQSGLDFSEFLQHGWFNDNHAKDITGIVGEPDPIALRQVTKGERLPTGLVAPANGHWAEGWLFENDPRADAIWNKILAVQKSPARRLGFSIEGTIQKRTGPENKTIAKARVRHVAITHCPVNTDTRLDRLAKAIGANASFGNGGLSAGDDAEDADDELEIEALAEDGLYLGPLASDVTGGLGARSALGTTSEPAEHVVPMDGVLDLDLGRPRPTPVPPGELTVVTRGLTAQGQGAVLIPESLERDAVPVHKSTTGTSRIAGGAFARGVGGPTLSAAEAIARVKARFPNITNATAGRVVDITIELARRGLI